MPPPSKPKLRINPPPAGSHGYFDALRARPECVQSFSLRDQAQLNSLVKRTPSQFFRYVYGNDPYPRPQDGAKLLKPPRNQFSTYFPGNPWGDLGDENVAGNQTLRIPVGVSSGSILITWDCWWGEEFQTNAGWGNNPVNAWKTFFLYAQGTESQWLGHDVLNLADRTAGELSKHHEGPVGTKQLPFAPGVIARDPYNPTGTGALPPRTFTTYVNRWTRYWLEYRLNVPGSEFTDWSQHALGGAPLTGTWDMVTLWIADEQRDPVRLLYRVPAARRPTDLSIAELRMAWDTSTNNLNGGGLIGPVIAYVRNVVMLHNATVHEGDTSVFARPV